ncbi:RHS repeat domain-containing protein [Pseudomonas huaxiensis]|uniref:RHS repeat domain-containing protein n=1 Tax=Pseudomonas huaxiensis TaxID=2213017 RepID=UPI000DA6BBA1|nr:RHS repeat-associated core domain-containing protein [Pseudomonas huaxiensis]
MAHNVMGIDPCDSQNHAIFNASTQKRNVVDPRTGLFEVCVPLPTIVGNSGNGPEVDMSLFYTPVVNNFAALGDGWSFGFTTWHETTKHLTLHSGEVLEISKGQKLDSPQFIARWESDDSILKIKSRAGRLETLKKVGSSKIYVPHTLTTDGANELYLEWTATEHTLEKKKHHQVRLAKISDKDRRLVNVDYSEPSASVAITFWPDDEAPLTFRLTLEDYALRSVERPEGTLSTFGYDDHDTCGWLLSSLETAEGVKETVVYEKVALKFDDAKLAALPVVTRHRLTPRGGNVSERVYSYSDIPDGYRTTLIEKADGTERKTHFKYDKKFELLEQVEEQGECKVTKRDILRAVDGTERSTLTVATTYKKKEQEFEEKVVNQISRFGVISDSEKAGLHTHYIYDGDDSASVTAHLKCGLNSLFGNKDTLDTVFDAFSNDNLKEEGHKATDFLKNKPKDPDFSSKYLLMELAGSAGFMGDGESSKHVEQAHLVRAYSYVSIPGMTEAKVHCVVQALNCASSMKDAARTVKLIRYYRDDDFRKGRQSSIVQGYIDDDNKFVVSGLEQCFEYTLEDTSLTTTTTWKDDVGNTRVERETRCILSGRLFSQLDQDGNRADYVYDKFHRLIERTLCAQSETYKQTTHYAYPFAGRLEITDPEGRQKATEDDGQDNLLSEFIRASATEEWQQMLKIEYDEMGRKACTIQYDYLADGTSIAERSDSQYDDWNSVCGQVFFNGQGQFDYYDPVSRTRTEWAGAKNDKQRQTTYYAKDGQAEKIEWTDAQAEVFRMHVMEYTPARQLKTIKKCEGDKDAIYYGGKKKSAKQDPFGIESIKPPVRGYKYQVAITYDYDAAGRVVREEHLDENCESPVYNYTYSKDWLISDALEISVDTLRDPNPLVSDFLAEEDEFFDKKSRKSISPESRKTLGKRTFDAWGRVASLTRGVCTETFTYNGASPVPATKNTADGKTLNYKYITELGGLISEVSEQDGPGKKTFTYATYTAEKSTATEGQRRIEMSHGLTGLVTSQCALSKKSARDTAKRTRCHYSPGGRLLSEKDALGHETIYSYNAYGQRDKTISGDVTTTHFYNPQGWLEKELISVGDDAQNEVEVEYTYNDQGLEVARRFKLPSKHQLLLKKEYDSSSRLTSNALEIYDDLKLDPERIDSPDEQGRQKFIYNFIGQLDRYFCSGVWARAGRNGYADLKYDCLGNVVLVGHISCDDVRSTPSPKATDTIDYQYDSLTGSRLEMVAVKGLNKPALEYDKAGRVIKDHYGKTYKYDWLGRLIKAGSVRYEYDAMDRLMLRSTDAKTEQHQLIYDGLHVRGEYSTKDKHMARHLMAGSGACIVQRVKRSGVERTLFELCDLDGTVRVSYDATAKKMEHHVYGPFGEHTSDEPDSLLGYKGEYRDVDNDQSPLGQGYRWYAPDSKQFHVQDSLSPFDQGGPQAYGYCCGSNPVMASDPTGHFINLPRTIIRNWNKGPGLIINRSNAKVVIDAFIWSGIGVLLAAVTGGTAMIALAAVACFAGVMSAVHKGKGNEKEASIWAWVSFLSTVAGGVKDLVRTGVKWLAKLGQSGMKLARAFSKQVKLLLRNRNLGLNSSIRSVNEYKYWQTAMNNPYGTIIAGQSHRTYGAITSSIVKKAWEMFSMSHVHTITYMVTGILHNTEAFEENSTDAKRTEFASNWSSLPAKYLKTLSRLRLR